MIGAPKEIADGPFDGKEEDGKEDEDEEEDAADGRCANADLKCTLTEPAAKDWPRH